MNFLIEEYKSLIENRNYRIREIRKSEILIVGAVSSLYAWFLNNNPTSFLLWFLPPLLSIFGLYRSLMLKKSINYIVEYIRKIEETMYKENKNLEGYETFRYNSPKSGVTKSVYIFWIILLIISLAISLNYVLKNV